ncbi:MAG: hypothetical protein NVS1B7_2570 [Candidatus Saccharimonadales bacterium]
MIEQHYEQIPSENFLQDITMDAEKRSKNTLRTMFAHVTAAGLAALGGVVSYSEIDHAPPAEAQASTAASTGRQFVDYPAVAIASTPDGQGFWVAGADGDVLSYDSAKFYGSMRGTSLNKPIVGIADTPDGQGYWLAASDGGIFSFGNAKFYGSTGDIKLNQPIVGIRSTPTGNGYWFVASDGGVFSEGDAKFYGSTGDIKLNQPIVGMASTPDGQGYWLVASDGGIFSFGNAKFYGSTGDIKLNKPIVGMDRTPTGNGYWLGAADSGSFNFGDAQYFGSNAANGAYLTSPEGPGPMVGIAASPVEVPRLNAGEGAQGYYGLFAKGGVAINGWLGPNRRLQASGGQ